MTMSKEEFEKKFRERIKPDTSNWRQRPAVDRSKRDEFRRSQRVATRILEFLEDNEDWSRQRLADALGVSLQRVSVILKGKANFRLQSIEKMEEILGINLLDENAEQMVPKAPTTALPVYDTMSTPSSEFHTNVAPSFSLDGDWYYMGELNFETLMAAGLVGESDFELAA